MKIRKIIAALVAGLLIACCVMIYLMLDVTLFPLGHEFKNSVKDNQWLYLENRLAKLEKEWKHHHDAVSSREKMNPQMKERILNPAAELLQADLNVLLSNPTDKTSTCNNFDMTKTPRVTIQMLNVYKQLKFDNPNGGVWKQGWNITYDEKEWHRNRKLKVFVVPHSHNDPGWLSTFEHYYTFQTQRILNNMVTHLAKDKRRKFIWAEMSYFKMWWDEQSVDTKEVVRRLVHDGQLELVSGGWVMPDESVSHWIAQLTQLTEGHQWLKANLDYVPSSGWTIDPFGLSPTMPLLYKGAQLENLVIQRVHYSVKKELAKKKNLEFNWRQLWDNEGSTELFTHMMPFYSYDVPHTCGPDPKVCCQFDFLRLLNFGVTCPWKVNPKSITKANVAERANLLLDQYRKKAQLYKTNVLLVPLGDDFRYSQSLEWDAQYDNYQKLFDYINKNQQLNSQVQFGTLTDYFNAVRKSKASNEFPSLSGDFFTYSDRDDHYWSGYYTSRPFHKRLDRVLLGSIRGSELLSTIAWIKGHDQLAEEKITSKISEARKWHSLFQHHDGVTGTARDNVVVDYAQKMIAALNNSAHVLQQSVAHLLKIPPNYQINSDETYFTLDEVRSHHTSVGKKKVLILGEDYSSKKVIFYNSLPRERTQVQTILISVPRAKVTDRMGRPVECQISPTWVGPATISTARFELSFLITVPGFGLTTYIIHTVSGNTLPKEVHLAKVILYVPSNATLSFSGVPEFNSPQIISNTQDFSISQNSNLSASFGQSGLLKALRVDKLTIPVHLEFVKYGTRDVGQDRSGAYLFLPDKPKPDLVSMGNNQIVHLVTGPLLSRVFVEFPYVQHTCTLFNSPGSDGLGLQIMNKVDISETHNFELAMRLHTDIASEDQFFTDLNGLNMIRRQRFSKIPIQGNYYPLASAGYIQDKRVRLTILTATPLGASSMDSGQFEIMQDRRLMQDDNRGLGQGVTDNLLTNHLFSVIVEKMNSPCSHMAEDHPSGLLSLAAHLSSEELLHPIVALHPRSTLPYELKAFFSPLSFDLASDMNVISLRIISVPEGAGKGVGMVLHRQALDHYCVGDSLESRFKLSKSGHIDLNRFLNFTEHWTLSEAPLTFHNVGVTKKSSLVNLCPHQVLATLSYRSHS